MAYNRKMRKFEGTCYIPGEQLAMMAKYYRGANLNLNLTLFEDDMASMQETLDQACWCSKLDELDRMKMSHMKGNEWRIQHDHCADSRKPPGRNNPMALTALPQRSKSTVKVERGTSALSLYDRERTLGRGRSDYSEPRYRGGESGGRSRRGYYDTPYTGDFRGPPEAQQNRRQTYRMGRMSDRRYEMERNVGRMSDRRYEMDSEPPMSSMPEHTDIKCAVCNVETCMICKNHLYSPICQCKCPVANAGLCNRCNQEPCEEEEPGAGENTGNKMDISSMMMAMMMSSMFQNPQTPGTVCCCKPSRENSVSSCSSSSDERVHKVYLYDCEEQQKNKKPKKKTKNSSSDSSSCDCCKCSRKPKTNSRKKSKGKKTSSEDGESDQKRKSSKGKGSKDSGEKSRRTDSDSESEQERKSRKSDAGKSTPENRKSVKGSKEEDKRSSKPSKEEKRSSKPSKEEEKKSSKDENQNKKSTSMKPLGANKLDPRGSKAQGSLDSRNVQFSRTKNSPGKILEVSTSESGSSKQTSESRQSPRKEKPQPDIQMSDTHANVPDIETSNHRTNTADMDEVGEESSTTFSIKEFIVSLPKIQANLQSLVTKLNEMDILNNQHHQARIDPAVVNAQRLGEFQIRQDFPLVASEEPINCIPGTVRDYPPFYNHDTNQESEISIGFMPCNNPNKPPSISPRSSKEGAKVHEPLNFPIKNQSMMNITKYVGLNQESRFNATLGKKNDKSVSVQTEVSESTKPFIKFPPSLEKNNSKVVMGNHGNVSIQTEQGSDFFKNAAGTIISSTTVHHGRPVRYPCPQDSNLVFSDGVFQNIEIIELPDNVPHSPGTVLRNESISAKPVTTSSALDGETIFQSYKRESLPESSEQDLTDYASCTDEKYFQPYLAESVQQASSHQEKNVDGRTTNLKQDSPVKTSGSYNVPQKGPRKYPNQPFTQKTNFSKSPKPRKFKAKQRSPLVLGKLIPGCAVRENSRFRGIKSKPINNHAVTQRNPIRPERGVGPGKFRRSKSDSSLDRTIGDQSEHNRPKSPQKSLKRENIIANAPGILGKKNAVVPLASRRSKNPTTEHVMHSGEDIEKNSFQLRGNYPNTQTEKQGNMNECRTISADSLLKMSDAYVRRQVNSQNFIVSSVELRAVSNDGSSTEILKMVQAASNSHTNETRASSELPQTTAYVSDFDIIPMLPQSSTTPGSDSNHENTSEVKKSMEVSPNTPAFLRKSRIQVEQLKRAHETIRSMIKNVNDVIAHIDSDSKIGIKSKTRNEDRERQSYFVHIDDETKPTTNGAPLDEKINSKNVGMMKKAGYEKPSCSQDEQDREVQEMFVSVNRVMNSVMTSSEQSSSAQDPQWLEETTTTTPSRAHRDFFVLNSESTSTAFTESLRRSLENDTTRSVPLATHRPPLRLETPQRPRNTRPLKRRSWFPLPK